MKGVLEGLKGWRSGESGVLEVEKIFFSRGSEGLLPLPTVTVYPNKHSSSASPEGHCIAQKVFLEEFAIIDC